MKSKKIDLKRRSSTGLPKEYSEKEQGKLGHTSNLKYADSEMGNPEELDRRNEALANEVRRKRSKQS